MEYYVFFRYCHWEMWAMFWIGLAATYLAECPLNARYYEFTAGMSVVSVTICSISNLLSDYRLNLPYGKYTFLMRFPITCDVVFWMICEIGKTGKI